MGRWDVKRDGMALGTGDTGVEISCFYYIISFPSIPHNPNIISTKPIKDIELQGFY